MADLRVTGGLPAPVPKPALPSEAARAAQRAFFQAALNAAAPAAPSRPVETQPAAPRAATLQAAPAAPATEPNRYMRPGSLLDIKV
jgi:hypothetical protein